MVVSLVVLSLSVLLLLQSVSLLVTLWLPLSEPLSVRLVLASLLVSALVPAAVLVSVPRSGGTGMGAPLPEPLPVLVLQFALPCHHTTALRILGSTLGMAVPVEPNTCMGFHLL